MSLLSKEEIGWLAGARDAQVGKVLALMHRKTATRWTLSSLANEAGTSRAVLAQRFRQYLGEPPLSYLTRWRLQLAAQNAQLNELQRSPDCFESGIRLRTGLQSLL